MPRPDLATLRGYIAANVRRGRVRLRLTQEGLAAAAGLDPKHVQKIEASRANPSIEVLFVIAEALGQPVARLLRKTSPIHRVAGRPRKSGQRAQG